MFGYILVNKPELKVREFDRYRSYYCGLCKTLKNNHGSFSRMTLNYDMTFLVMLLNSMYEPETHTEKKRCIVHPFSRHDETVSEVTDYASDLNIILSWYNLKDDWEDDRKLSSGLAMLLLKGKASRAEKKHRGKADRIKKHLSRLSEIEKDGEPDIEIPACEFGKVMGECFIYKDNEPMNDSLYNVGFHLGKFIYILDAYEDLEEDIKKNEYNGLKGVSKEKTEEMLRMAMASCASEFEHLPLIDDVEIMRNILYAGCWTRYHLAGEKKTDESL